MVKKQPDPIQKLPRWYYGGVASTAAACVTHPLDLLKVHLQTSKSTNEFKLLSRVNKILKVQGLHAMYNGLTASIFRQLTYSTTRFGLYEVMKQSMSCNNTNMPFHQKVALGAIAGAAGGFLGTPGDLINVRMQNDIKLPADLRRNYFHVFDGLRTVAQYEGIKTLFNGSTMATSRAILMTIGQLAIYDQIKQTILESSVMGKFEDDTLTHVLASLLSGTCATTMTLPLDVIKTRMMNENAGTYKGNFDAAKSIYRDLGPLGFFRGFVPAFIRLTPQTVLTFVFLEQLRLRFGTDIFPASC